MSHVEMPESRRKRPDRKHSGLYLPAWSIGAMLLIVIAIVVALVTLLITLGGGTPATGEPRVVIITAVPTETPLPALLTVTPNPTAIPQAGGTAGTAIPVPEFALEGPTLQPIVFTPTPLTLAVGVTVRNDADGLNVREAPGLDQTILFQAEQNALFRVISGPEQASDITWWKIEDPSDPTRSGWAAADYLLAQP